MFWISLAFTYLSECPVNARYYEFTVGMSVVSVTICSISNLLSDYRLSIPYGKLLTKQSYIRFSFLKTFKSNMFFPFFTNTLWGFLDLKSELIRKGETQN